MKYAVVVVTYNRLTLLKECMYAIFNQERMFDDIVIVDNGSTDGTKEYLSDYKDKKNTTILRYEENGGGAFGFTEGIKEVVSHNVDWILLIDDDAILNLDFLKVTDDFIQKESVRAGAYTCTVLTFDKIYTRHRARHIRKGCFWLKSVPLEEYDKDSFDCEVASFCGLIVSKKIVNKIGFPKAEYFIWQDDEEYCERINKYTCIRNINKAILNHKTGKTFNDLNWKMYYGARNEIDKVKSHYGIVNRIICLIRVCVRCVKYIITANKYSYTRMEVLKMYAKAIHDGLHGQLGVNRNYYPR